MKFLFFVCFGLIFSESLFGIETEEAVLRLASDLSNREYEREVANALMNEKGEQNATRELFNALISADSVEAEAAVVGIFLQFDPFPFDAMEALHHEATRSTERAYALHLMNLGADGESEINRLLDHAKASLSDGGLGIRRYGEAAAYSPEGNRPKDIGYNILVVRNGLKGTYPVVNVDNFSESKRDDLIERLAADLGVVLTTKATNSNEESAQAATNTTEPRMVPNQIAEEESVAESGESEESSFPSWALAVIVVAALGILALLIRAFMRGRAS
jgi:hypothetical protein